MAGMNWDRVRREKPLIDGYDYSRAADERERGIGFDRERAELFNRMETQRSGRATAARPAATGRATAQRSPTRDIAAGAMNSPKRTGESKGQRDERIAASLEITVPELKARRQAEAKRERELKVEADRRGIKVAKLRKLLVQDHGPAQATCQGAHRKSVDGAAVVKRTSPRLIISRGRRGATRS